MDYTNYKLAQAKQNEMLRQVRRLQQVEMAKQQEEQPEIIPAARPARKQIPFILRLFGRAGDATF